MITDLAQSDRTTGKKSGAAGLSPGHALAQKLIERGECCCRRHGNTANKPGCRIAEYQALPGLEQRDVERDYNKTDGGSFGEPGLIQAWR